MGKGAVVWRINLKGRPFVQGSSLWKRCESDVIEIAYRYAKGETVVDGCGRGLSWGMCGAVGRVSVGEK